MLKELGVDHLPLVRPRLSQALVQFTELLHTLSQLCGQVTVWNKIDAVAAPETVRAVASAREGDGTVCISAATGEGIDSMLALLDRYIAALLLPVRCMLPFSQVRNVTAD